MDDVACPRTVTDVIRCWKSSGLSHLCSVTRLRTVRSLASLVLGATAGASIGPYIKQVQGLTHPGHVMHVESGAWADRTCLPSTVHGTAQAETLRGGFGRRAWGRVCWHACEQQSGTRSGRLTCSHCTVQAHWSVNSYTVTQSDDFFIHCCATVRKCSYKMLSNQFGLVRCCPHHH